MIKQDFSQESYYLILDLKNQMKKDNQKERPFNQLCFDLIGTMPKRLRKPFIETLKANLEIIVEMQKNNDNYIPFKPKLKRGRKKSFENLDFCMECGQEIY